MNHNEITRMAREAGLFVPRAGLPENGALIRFFHAAYAAGAAAESEACAKWLEDVVDAPYLAERIRARSQV